MLITAECPTCGFKGSVPDQFKGKKVKCRECSNMFTVGGEPAPAKEDIVQDTAEEIGTEADVESSGGSNMFDFDAPEPPPQPVRKSAQGTARKPAAASGTVKKPARAAAERPQRPLKKKRREPPPIMAMVLGGIAAVMGLVAILVAKKGMIGLASVPVGGFGMLLGIAGVVMALGRPGFWIAVPILGLLVCLGALPLGGYHTFNLIAEMTKEDLQAKKGTEPGDSPEASNPQRTPISGLPAPTPADLWMNPFQGFRIGKVHVRIQGVDNDLLRTRDGKAVSTSKHLLIRVEIRNGSSDSVDYFSWATPPQGDPLPQLTDNKGNVVKWAQPEGVMLANQVLKAQEIAGNQSLTDVLAFELPADSIEHVRLELPAANVGEKGKFKFELQKAFLATAVRPDIPGPNPAPPPPDSKVAKLVQDQLGKLQTAKTEGDKLLAITLLGGCGKDAAPAAAELAGFLNKRQPEKVRVAAAEALSKIGPGARMQIPELIAALKDEFWTVRANAAKALGNIGPEARAAIPELVPLLKSKDEEVAQNAREAIRKIDPNKLPKQ